MSETLLTGHDLWSGHQLLAFSGLDGPLDWGQALEARLLPDRLGVVFDSLAGAQLALSVVTSAGLCRWLPGTAEADAFAAWVGCRLGGDQFTAELELPAELGSVVISLGFATEDLLRGSARWQPRDASVAFVASEADDPPPTLALELCADGCRRVDAKGLVLDEQQLRLVIEPSAEAVALAPESAVAVLRGEQRGARHYLGEPVRQGGLYRVPLSAGREVQFGLAVGRERPAPVLLEPESLAAWLAPRPPVPVPVCLCGLTPRQLRARAKAISILRGATFGAQGFLSARWMTSQRRRHRSFNTFHAPFLAAGAVTFDPDLGRDVMCAALGLQQSDGRVPELGWPAGTTTGTGAPLLCWGFWQVYRCTRDVDLLADAAPRLKDYVKHPLVSRMLERSGSGRCQGGKFLSWGRGEGSGMDNSPRFDINEPFAAVDLTSYAVSEIELISRIIEELSPEHREAVHLGWMGEELGRETRDYFWNTEHGWFCDRYGDGDWVDVPTLAGIVPLFAGVASDAQAQILVEGQLQDRAGFWTPFPLASLRASDQRFTRNMWRGGVFPTHNLLALRGLRRYGFDDAAARLRELSLEQLLLWFERTGTFWEFYDAQGELSPAELPRGRRVGALPEHAVTAAVFLQLLCECPHGDA